MGSPTLPQAARAAVLLLQNAAEDSDDGRLNGLIASLDSVTLALWPNAGVEDAAGMARCAESLAWTASADCDEAKPRRLCERAAALLTKVSP